MNKRLIYTITAAVLFGSAALAGDAYGAKGGIPGPPDGGEDSAGNNLSFPAIAVDGFPITLIETVSFDQVYTGDFEGLTQEQIDYLDANGPWYPQKTEGNIWQADWISMEQVDVTCVDWSDSIEAVDPKVRRPFRLEVVLFKNLNDLENPTTMTAFTMAELENPSSPDELQGTNTFTTDSAYATVVSGEPGLVIQYLGTDLPPLSSEDWDDGSNKWGDYPIVPASFAVELNVGGKYIFGASEGGWKPDQLGWYRATFYTRPESGVNMTTAFVGNFNGDECLPPAAETEAEEGGGATPVVDTVNNLSYVDMQVIGGGGGGGGGGQGNKPN